MTDIHKKNKLKTAGYFIKRLKDNGFVTLRILISIIMQILESGQY